MPLCLCVNIEHSLNTWSTRLNVNDATEGGPSVSNASGQLGEASRCELHCSLDCLLVFLSFAFFSATREPAVNFTTALQSSLCLPLGLHISSSTVPAEPIRHSVAFPNQKVVIPCFSPRQHA